MAYLVVRHNLALLLAHDAVLLLLAHKHHLNRTEQVLLANKLPALFDGINSCLVNHVCKVSAHSSAGCKSYLVQINRFVHLYVLGMNLKYIYTAFKVRLVNNNAPVETSRPQERLVKDFRPVGCRKDYNSLLAVETVHLR